MDHLRSAIRAGLSLPEALIQLSYRGPEELRDAFAIFRVITVRRVSLCRR